MILVERIRSELLETRTTKTFLFRSDKNMPYIEAKDFHVSFPGNLFKMKSCNFIIDRLGLYVLAGKNGTGKTSFFDRFNNLCSHKTVHHAT